MSKKNRVTTQNREKREVLIPMAMIVSFIIAKQALDVTMAANLRAIALAAAIWIPIGAYHYVYR